MKEKIKLTHEQIQKIAEDISVICFRSDPNTKEYVLLEYPKVYDVFVKFVKENNLEVIYDNIHHWDIFTWCDATIWF